MVVMCGIEEHAVKQMEGNLPNKEEGKVNADSTEPALGKTVASEAETGAPAPVAETEDPAPVVKKLCVYMCPECDAEYSVSSDLVRHQKLKRHAVFPCDGCKRVFLTESALGDHTRMTGHGKEKDGIIVESVGAVSKSPKTTQTKEKSTKKKDGKTAKGKRNNANRRSASPEDDDGIDSSWWRRAAELPPGNEPIIRLLPAKSRRNNKHGYGRSPLRERDSGRGGTPQRSRQSTSPVLGGGRVRSATCPSVDMLGEGRGRSATCPSVDMIGEGRGRSTTCPSVDMIGEGVDFKPHPAQQGLATSKGNEIIQGRIRASTDSHVEIPDFKPADSKKSLNVAAEPATRARSATAPNVMSLEKFKGPLWKTELELDCGSGNSSDIFMFNSSGENSPRHGKNLEAITEMEEEGGNKANEEKATKKKKKAKDPAAKKKDPSQADPDKIFQCLSCSKSFNTESSLMGHTGGAVSGTKFPCSECDAQYCNRYELSNHRWEQRHGVPEPVRCPTCCGLFGSQTVLKAHWDGEDHAPPYRGVRCPGCVMTFCSQRALYQHSVLWGHFAPDHIFHPLPNPYCIRGTMKRQIQDKTMDLTIDNPFFSEGALYLVNRSEMPDVFVTVTNEVHIVKAWLLDHVLCMEGEENVVGVDVEWKAVWKKNHPDPNKVALLQFSVEQHCLVIQMCQLPELPGELLFLLASPKFLKVGSGIKEDLERLERYYNIFCHGYYDVGVVASFLLKDVRSGTSLSLVNVAKRLCGVKLSKAKTITRSNWELVNLTEAQIRYAAIDAVAGFKLHKILKQHIVNDLEHFQLDHKIHQHLSRLYHRNKAPKDLLSALNNFCGTEKSLEMCYGSLFSQFKLKDACFRTRLSVECVKKGYPVPHFESYEYEAKQGCIHSNVMLKGQVIGASYSFDKSDSLETATEYALNHIMMLA